MEIALDARGEFLDRGRLGQTRRAFHEQVTVGQQRDQETVDQGDLADDALAQLVAQRVEGRAQAGDSTYVPEFMLFASRVKPDGRIGRLVVIY